MADPSQTQQKTYHKKTSGLAYLTAKKCSKESDLKLYGSCFWYVKTPCLKKGRTEREKIKENINTTCLS